MYHATRSFTVKKYVYNQYCTGYVLAYTAGVKAPRTANVNIWKLQYLA